jgi:hypothetical protein
MSPGEWPSIEPDVLLPVEEVWPVAPLVPDGETKPLPGGADDAEAAEAHGVDQPHAGCYSHG